MERDPRVGAWSEFDELERLRSWRGQRDQGAGLWSKVVEQEWLQQSLVSLCRLLHKNWGQNKLSFGVFCSVLLSQEPQPAADVMRVTQEAEGRERGDDSDLRGGGCHRDTENASFARWSHWDVKHERHSEMRAAGE